jgi:hypothetical protein
MSETFTGHCTCNFVRYRLTSRPMFVNCCHCRWCQRETGSAFVINATIEADRMELLAGEVELVDTPSLSGAGQQIARCPKCRVALWSNYSSLGALVRFVRVGTLDEPDRLPPDAHIFTMSKQPWVVLPPGAPVFHEFYEREKLWSADSLARRKALEAKLAR